MAGISSTLLPSQATTAPASLQNSRDEGQSGGGFPFETLLSIELTDQGPPM
jgi:hypothetical protein